MATLTIQSLLLWGSHFPTQVSPGCLIGGVGSCAIALAARKAGKLMFLCPLPPLHGEMEISQIQQSVENVLGKQTTQQRADTASIMAQVLEGPYGSPSSSDLVSLMRELGTSAETSAWPPVQNLSTCPYPQTCRSHGALRQKVHPPHPPLVME